MSAYWNVNICKFLTKKSFSFSYTTFSNTVLYEKRFSYMKQFSGVKFTNPFTYTDECTYPAYIHNLMRSSRTLYVDVFSNCLRYPLSIRSLPFSGRLPIACVVHYVLSFLLIAFIFLFLSKAFLFFLSVRYQIFVWVL